MVHEQLFETKKDFKTFLRGKNVYIPHIYKFHKKTHIL